MTQCERVLKHIQQYGTITTKQAYDLYGITRLGARIYDLKNQGYDIVADSVPVKNRFGEKAHVARYKLNDR